MSSRTQSNDSYILTRQQGMAAWTGLGCYFAGPTVQWRLCLSLQIVSPLLLLLGSPWLPESPRWWVARDVHLLGDTWRRPGQCTNDIVHLVRLISHNKERQGLEVLQKLHVRLGDSSDIAAKEEFYQIRKQIELEKQTGVTTMWGMLKRRSYRKRILCGILVQYTVISSVKLMR